MPCTNHPDVEEGLVHCSLCGKSFCRDCVVELKGCLCCAECKAERLGDLLSGVDPTRLELASIGRRFWAVFIDNILLVAVQQAITLPVSTIAGATPGDVGVALQILGMMGAMVFGIGLPLVYEGLMLQFFGQTLGKMAMKVRVVTPEGADITAGQAWLRAVIRLVLGCTAIVDYIPAFFVADKQCVHDMAARTRVVIWRP